MPEAPTPPNGTWASSRQVESFTCTIPEWTRSANDSPRPGAPVYTALTSPYGVSLTSSSASSSESTASTGATGPKISSLHTGISRRHVDHHRRAVEEAVVGARPRPPWRPLRTDSSTIPCARSSWPSEIIGPRPTSPPLGSPTSMPRARVAILST